MIFFSFKIRWENHFHASKIGSAEINEGRTSILTLIVVTMLRKKKNLCLGRVNLKIRFDVDNMFFSLNDQKLFAHDFFE